jgi:hypothetical protein
MSYNMDEGTITVNDVVYNVHAVEDRGHPETTYTIKEFDLTTNDWVFPFDGLEGTVAYEESDISHANPRDWSNVGTMAVSYRGYNLGDEDISEIDFEIECDECKGSGVIEHPVEGDPLGTADDCHVCNGDGRFTVDPARYFKAEHGARVVIGLFVYEHSGITMSAGPRVGDVLQKSDVRSTDRFMGDSAGWDTSFVGFVFDTPEMVKACIGDDATDEQIEAALRDEVKVYASYLEGDVTYYSVQDEETGYHDSCFGFVGDHKHTVDECYASLEHAIEARLAENNERAEWNARGTETR